VLDPVFLTCLDTPPDLEHQLFPLSSKKESIPGARPPGEVLLDIVNVKEDEKGEKNVRVKSYRG
jgi:hypothetical protein